MTSVSLSATLMTYEVFKERGRSLGRAVFLARHASPFLLLTTRGELGQGEGFGFRTGATPLGGPGLDSLGPAYVAPVAKRDVNKFSAMITVGRATNNDVRIDLSSVSKFHAYFMNHPSSGVWHLLDASSSNGTFVNGVQLTPDRNPTVVKSGDEIRFGADVEAVFFDAAAIYDLTRS